MSSILNKKLITEFALAPEVHAVAMSWFVSPGILQSYKATAVPACSVASLLPCLFFQHAGESSVSVLISILDGAERSVEV